MIDRGLRRTNNERNLNSLITSQLVHKFQEGQRSRSQRNVTY